MSISHKYYVYIKKIDKNINLYTDIDGIAISFYAAGCRFNITIDF